MWEEFGLYPEGTEGRLLNLEQKHDMSSVSACCECGGCYWFVHGGKTGNCWEATVVTVLQAALRRGMEVTGG